MTGKTTCPPGSLPSGEPTPGAGATRDRQHHRPAALRQAGGRPAVRPLGDAARAVQPAADLHPAAGADQGQAHLMTVFAGRGGRDVRRVRDRCRLHAGRRRAGAGAGHRQASRHDRRLRRDPHPCRDRDLRGAGERGRQPAPGRSAHASAARPSSSRASRSGAIPTGWSGRSTSGLREVMVRRRRRPAHP